MTDSTSPARPGIFGSDGRIAGRVARAAARLLFPPRCLACGGFEETTGDRLCFRCATAMNEARIAPSCPTCAADVAPHEVKLDRCSQCRGHAMKVVGSVRVGSYRSSLGSLLRAYKYNQREELSPLLSRWLSEAIVAASWRDRVEGIVSVPTHWRRRITRSFHAADALASLAARRLDLPHLPLLRRLRAGPRQVGLSVTRRAENVRGAFALRPGVSLREARLLLVDDVRTTGATLEECARVLRRAGAAEVYSAVICRVSFDVPDTPTLSSI